MLLVSVSAVMALGCLVRLLLEERASKAMRREAGPRGGVAAGGAPAGAGLAQRVAGGGPATAPMAALTFQARSAAAHLGDKAERVLEQAHRAQEIVRGMVEAFRLARPAHRQAVDIGLLLEETVHSAFDEGPSLHVRLEGTRRLPPVWGDPGALGVAFQHLIRNAAQASPGGRPSISAANDTRELTLRFVDDGPGVPAEVGPHVFDPFFTTRPVGEGLGLGLTQVHFIARDHGGAVVLEPSAFGATFALRLPVRERRTGQPVQPPWPLSIAVLTATVAALVIAIWPSESGRVRWSESWQVVSALGAAGALASTAARRTGRSRAFWGLLAMGPLWWSLPALMSLAGGAAIWGEHHVVAEGLLGAATLSWTAALLVRPDRPRPRGSPLVPWLGGLAILVLLVHAYLFVLVLPGWLSVREEMWRARTLLAQGASSSRAHAVGARALPAHARRGVAMDVRPADAAARHLGGRQHDRGPGLPGQSLRRRTGRPGRDRAVPPAGRFRGHAVAARDAGQRRRGGRSAGSGRDARRQPLVGGRGRGAGARRPRRVSRGAGARPPRARA